MQFLRTVVTAVMFPLAWILEPPGLWLSWEGDRKEGTDGWSSPKPPVECDLSPCSKFHGNVTKEWREWRGDTRLPKP